MRTPASGTPSSDDAAHRERLIARIASGERCKFLPFWGHTEKRPGTVDAACLSQWYPAPFEADGLSFATAEHFMMYGKAKLFGDDAIAARVLADPRPAVAKKLGREVRGFTDPTWEAARFSLIVRGNVHKFGQHTPLREFLLRTGTKILVEASPMDRIWGIGLAVTSPAVEDPQKWRGLNLLGFALMEARAELAAR